jgi:hypothetical protein
LDASNRVRAEAEKNIKKYQQQIRVRTRFWLIQNVDYALGRGIYFSMSPCPVCRVSFHKWLVMNYYFLSEANTSIAMFEFLAKYNLTCMNVEYTYIRGCGLTV